jgi:hypothetical protein
MIRDPLLDGLTKPMAAKQIVSTDISKSWLPDPQITENTIG